jgi:hypothetical protein
MGSGGGRMQDSLKHLGLTQLEKALPTLIETARQEQWTYDTFFTRAIAAEIEGRDRRAAERRRRGCPSSKAWRPSISLFNPALANDSYANWLISPLSKPARMWSFSAPQALAKPT